MYAEQHSAYAHLIPLHIDGEGPRALRASTEHRTCTSFYVVSHMATKFTSLILKCFYTAGFLSRRFSRFALRSLSRERKRHSPQLRAFALIIRRRQSSAPDGDPGKTTIPVTALRQTPPWALMFPMPSSIHLSNTCLEFRPQCRSRRVHTLLAAEPWLRRGARCRGACA